MELARTELSRIVGYQNPNNWCIDRNETFHQHRYYFFDRCGVNAYGDTVLHRLLALHASPGVIRNFIDHMQEHRRRLEKIQQGECISYMGPYAGLPKPVPLDQANLKGVTVLHVAVYRNSLQVDEIVDLLIQECPKLASMAMVPCRNYPLHITTGLSITIRRELIHLLLKANAKAAWLEDSEGNNPLSLLWKNVLRFRWARQWEQHGLIPTDMKGDVSWMTVISPSQYLEFSLSILEEAYGRSVLDWNDVCGFPRCPPLLIRMILQQQQQQQPSLLRGSMETPDAIGRYPLHWAAISVPVNHINVPLSVAKCTTSLVEMILTISQGRTVNIVDHNGRYPLHYACDNKQVPALHALVCVGHEVLRAQDPLTGLYPAFQIATRKNLRQQTNFIYEILRKCPEILSFWN